jgi:hypothetical protein
MTYLYISIYILSLNAIHFNLQKFSENLSSALLAGQRVLIGQSSALLENVQ